ncbi:MAG: saccharopine dehydrogenase NADP-binding domain-containing protein [Candidatus Obscuribacterales bacterium]|nr:saccharopine dehydrogenase NADP-binding domain-containing protein [Candidatus Obscuribacterales bacterium]
MKFLVLGAGKMGYAVAYDLIRSPKVEKVVLTDRSESILKSTADRLKDPKLVAALVDVTNERELGQLMEEVDVAISCVTYEHNYELTKLALSTRTHFVDLGGNEELVRRQFLLDELAKERGVSIIPDAGLAPGMVSLLAASAAESLDEVYDMRIRVGGVPVDREINSLGYAQVFSVEGLINEYSEDCTLIRDGRLIQLPALSELEEIEFPPPFGLMEAFNTSGGISTLPQSYLNRIQHLDYKTVRYIGHCQSIKAIQELGFFSTEKFSGSDLCPRAVLAGQLAKHLPVGEPDAVLLRVSVSGNKSGKPSQLVFDCVDYADQAVGLSAMMRMTAFPASILGQMLARGDINRRGVLRQEESVPTRLFLTELSGRGIAIKMAERTTA